MRTRDPLVDDRVLVDRQSKARREDTVEQNAASDRRPKVGVDDAHDLTHPRELVNVGRTSLGVALAGVVVPFAAGFVYVVLHGDSPKEATFVATATDTVLAEVPVGREPTGVAFSRDGTRAYVTNTRDATVAVIDTQAVAVVKPDALNRPAIDQQRTFPAEILDFVDVAGRAKQRMLRSNGRIVEQVFCSFIGASPREDFIPYVADFYLQLEDVKWTIVAGIVNDTMIISVRNLGYTKNAGEFVRRFFADIGSAGGHRAMAKAVIPMRAFREKFGDLTADNIGPKLQELVTQFLHEAPAVEKKRETAGIKN